MTSGRKIQIHFNRRNYIGTLDLATEASGSKMQIKRTNYFAGLNARKVIRKSVLKRVNCGWRKRRGPKKNCGLSEYLKG